jgi:LmbE family N-acetylglucosaminyl deacetylase
LRILAFFAHPDDETILAGGCLALLAKLGHEVYYLICTRGEGGETGSPPVCNQNQLGFFREKELKNAVNSLGGKTLNLLDYIDPIVGADNRLFPFTNEPEKVVKQLEAQINKNNIDILITHGSNGEYGHPAHKLVFQIAKSYIDHSDKPIFWYTVQAKYDLTLKPHLLNQDDTADWVLDTKTVRNEKIQAAKAHLSQNALFVRRKSKELGRQVAIEEVIVDEESYHLVFGANDPLYELFSQMGFILPKGIRK